MNESAGETGFNWNIALLILGVIGGGIMSLLGWLGSMLITWRKQNTEDRERLAVVDAKKSEADAKLCKEEDERADRSYHDVINMLTAQMKTVKDDVRELSKQHSECEKAQAELKVEIRYLAAKSVECETNRADLQRQVNELKQKAA